MRYEICIGALIASLAATSDANARCDFSAPRSADVDANGATRIVIDARSGDLVVRGAQTTRVKVQAEACGSSQRVLDSVQLESKRDGSTVFITAIVPNEESMFGGTWLDMKIELPNNLAVEITDSSGDIDAAGIGAAKIEDSSGDIKAREVAGSIRVTDSSGDVRLSSIKGDAAVTDSSGDIQIEDVAGSVTVPVDSSGGITVRRAQGSVHVMTDSSGDIAVSNVGKDVIVDNDSSGDIRVSDVAGEFKVLRDSSGDVSHRNVVGAIHVPKSDDD